MKDIVSSFTATALIQASNIGSGVLLARFLQPDGRGELAAVILWPSVIGGIGIIGLHEAVAYYAARRPQEAGGFLRASLALGLALCALLMPLAALVAHVVFADSRPEVREAAFLYVAFLPLHFAASFAVGLFQGMLRFAQWNLLRVLMHVAYFLLIPLFYALGWGGVYGFAAASLLSLGLVAAASLIGCARAGWLSPTAAAPVRQAAPALARYGLTVHLGATIAIIAERLDQMIISVMLSAADLGLFVVAVTVARLPLVVASTLGTVAFPKIAAAVDDETRTDLFGRYARATMLTVVPSALFLAAVMPWLLTWFFGPAFAAATPLAWLLVVGAVPLSLKAMITAGLKGYNRGAIVSQAEIVTLGLSAAALAALVPSFGLMGAAAASVAAQGGALVFLLLRIKQATGIRPSDLLLPRRDDLAVIGDMLAAVKGRVTGPTGGAK
jgi:O-antigen/teichoic acid export membrane protein